MSQHPSLRISDKDKKQRSVLKRHERLKLLKEKESWAEKDSVFGLPKVKITRFKIKKEKAAAVEGAEGAAAVGAAAVPGTAPAAAKETGKATTKEAGKTAAAEAKKETKK